MRRMRCALCGAKAAGGAQFCGRCGAPVVAQLSVAAVPAASALDGNWEPVPAPGGAAGSPPGEARARKRYFLAGLAACLVLFITGLIGIHKAPARSGLSVAMEWVIGLSLAGAALSVELLLHAFEGRRAVRRLGCPGCGAQMPETAPFCVTCGTPAADQPSAAGPGGYPAGYAADLATWAERAGSASFAVTRLRPGYVREDVDAFLEAIRDTFLGVRQPPLTAREVQDVKFSTTRLRPGYDEEDVDAFLDEVQARLAMRCAKCQAPVANLSQACAECGAPSAGQQSLAADQAPDRPGGSPAVAGGATWIPSWAPVRHFLTWLNDGIDQQSRP